MLPSPAVRINSEKSVSRVPLIERWAVVAEKAIGFRIISERGFYGSRWAGVHGRLKRGRGDLYSAIALPRDPPRRRARRDLLPAGAGA